MNFLEAEQEFKALEKKWSNGEISIDTYREILKNLQVTNASGQVWKMQEHTGLWFFLQNGKWIPASEIQHVQATPVKQTATQATLPARHRGLKLGMVIALVGLCLLSGVAITAGILVYTEIIPLPEKITISLGLPSPKNKEEPETSPAVLKPVETTSVIPNGKPQTDSNGVSLVVPGESLEQGDQVNLSANELNAPWLKTIQKSVKVETPFYNLSVPGKNDSTGSLSLSFPAATPKTRLLAVIDDNFLVELAQLP
jgi:hypothetical protein